MPIERGRIRPLITSKARNGLEILRDQAIYRAVSATAPVVRLGEKNISKTTQKEYEGGFWSEYVFTRRNGYHPILVANHTSHQDGKSISLVTAELMFVEKQLLRPNLRLEGFQIPLAMSLANGDQGPGMQALYEAEYPLLTENHLIPLLLTRTKDQEKYGTKQNLLRYYKEVSNVVKENYGIVVFPEGTTTAGKRNEDGKLNGMQPFESDSLRSLISAGQRAGKKIMLIPVSITGGYRVHNPETKLPTGWAFRVGLGLSDRSLVKIKVGLPMRVDDGILAQLLNDKDWNGVNDLVSNKIATNLPDIQKPKK